MSIKDGLNDIKSQVDATDFLPETPNIGIPENISNTINTSTNLNPAINTDATNFLPEKPSIILPDNAPEPEDDNDPGDNVEEIYTDPPTEKSSDQILIEFCNFEEAAMSLSKLCTSPLSCEQMSVKEIEGGIQGIYNFKKNIDEFGKALKYGSECSVCGKHMDHVPPNSYCSIECFLEDLKKRALAGNTGNNDFTKYINQIRGILNMLTLTLNLVAEFPQKLVDAAKLPDEYRNYVQIH